MGSRYLKANKKCEVYTGNIDIFIERLKKVRALNCSPSDVGIDNYGLKRMQFNNLNVLTKFL